MARLGTSNYIEKEKTIIVQDTTWKSTLEKERMIEVLHHKPPATYHDEAQRRGPAISVAHATHVEQSIQHSVAERPAGKCSAIGMHWGIQ